jgi:hypothetical protein
VRSIVQAGVAQDVAVEEQLLAALLLPEALPRRAVLGVLLDAVFEVGENEDAAIGISLNASGSALGGVKPPYLSPPPR